MSISKLSILLEILGFLTGSVFVMIFLDTGAIGKFSEKLSRWFNTITTRLLITFPSPTRKQLNNAIWYSSHSIFLITAIILIIIGLLTNNHLLFISGISYIGGFLSYALFMVFGAKYPVQTLKHMSLDLLILVAVIPLLLFTASISIIRIFTQCISNNPKGRVPRAMPVGE